jgi:hypothetical protein
VNAASFTAGDNIYFEKGETWREQLTVPSSGNSTHQITFGAYGSGEKPIISGFNISTGWSSVGNGVYSATVTTEPKIVSYNGILLISNNTKTTNVNTNEWDWDSNILYVNVSEDPDLGVLEIGQRDYVLTTSNKDFITIENLGIVGANIASISFNAGADNWIIKNNELSKTLRGINAGTSVDGDNNTIQNNTIHDTVEYAIDWNSWTDSTNNIFQNNTIYNVGGKGGSTNNMQGMYISIGSGTIIENNTIYNTGDSFGDHGIYLGNGADGIIVRSNNISNTSGWGVKISNSSNIGIYYNLLYENDIGGVIIEVGTPTNISIYNNVIANTGINASDQGLKADAGNNITWKNNIIYDIYYSYLFDEGTKYNLVVSSGVTNFTSDYNVVYSPRATAYYAYYQGSPKNWSEWQALGYA